MNAALRNSSAHVFVNDLAAPQLDPDDRHHLAKVLRLREGEIVSCSDGAGGWRLVRWSHGDLLVHPGDDPVVGGVDAVAVGGGAVRHDLPPAYDIAVAFVPVKGERSEWTVQKLTELGVDRIVPLLPTRRAVVKWSGERLDKQLIRWQRVAREAAMQSRRTRLPVVESFVTLADVCSRSGAAVADPDGSELDAATRLIVIGPEGGFDPVELRDDVPRVALGDTILRAETATLVAATLLGRIRESQVPRTKEHHRNG
ncbi:MAG: RsmE family RNA methyltransferase [Ilumatobacteraceae bacterium]